MERMGMNAAFNSGAIEYKGKILLMVRAEGVDRKSFFAIAESSNGVDNFRFWDFPIQLSETSNLDINVYDMRVVQHEDGWIYGLFCTERKDPDAPRTDTSSAIAQCGIIRTKEMLFFIQNLFKESTHSTHDHRTVLSRRVQEAESDGDYPKA
jgi:4-O-beta-D-mannosyl-D-glucose phosphorylase